MDKALDQILNKLNSLEFESRSMVSDLGSKSRFNLKDILYITTGRRGYCIFVSAEHGYPKKRNVKGTLRHFENLFLDQAPHFKKSHNSYIVNTHKVRAVDKTSKGHYSLTLEGLLEDKERIPLTRHFAPTFTAMFGLDHLNHLEPFNKTAEKIRSWGLKSFGKDEIKKLNLSDKRAVARFKSTYGIYTFFKDRLTQEFPQSSNPKKLDQARLIRNGIYQVFQWVRWGVIDQFSGSIRRIWYKYLGPVLKKAYPDKKEFPGEESDLYDYFNDFVELGIFTYAEFGFMDRYEFNRWVGEENPEVLIFMEKTTVIKFPRRLAKEYSSSLLVTSGQVPWLTAEYMAKDLKEVISDANTPLKFFTLTDLNPGGYSIGLNLKKRFEFHGMKNIEIIPVISPKLYSDSQIKENRAALISWKEYKKGKKTIYEPVSLRDKRLFPTYFPWFFGEEGWEGINDERLITRRKYKNYTRVTIYGMELDSLELDDIEAHFKTLIKKHLPNDAPVLTRPQLPVITDPVDYITRIKQIISDPDTDAASQVKSIQQFVYLNDR